MHKTLVDQERLREEAQTSWAQLMAEIEAYSIAMEGHTQTNEGLRGNLQ